MKRKISIRMCLICLLATVLSAALTTVSFYNLNTKRVWTQLEDLAKVFANVSDDIENLKRVAGGVGNHYRVTLVDEKGKVKYDSRVKYEKLGNHNNREEIVKAREAGTATAVRHSDSVGKKTYYFAMKVDYGNILRVAVDTDSIRTTFVSVIPLILLVAFCAFMLCFILSQRLTQGLIRPIEEMAKGEIEVPYEELEPFANLIKQQKAVEKMKQEFTANVSHELKTPLTSISGYAELIESGMAKGEDVKIFSGKIYSESKRLMSLIGDIMKLSELEEPGSVCHFEKFSLMEVIYECKASLELPARKHHVTIHVEGKDIPIFGDRKMISEVVYNLCDNAIRYNHENGQVWVSVSLVDDEVYLIVKDTGIGIPEKYYEDIFRRFYRVDKSRSKETGGTGLGLAIVKHIAELHGAKIRIDSKVQKGTKITLIFKAVGGKQ